MLFTLLKYLLIFGISTGEIWVAVPVGIAYKLNPVLVLLISTAGALTGMFVILFIGGKIRNFITKRVKKKEEKKESNLIKIWRKYGVIGLGIIGPVIVGSPVVAALGILLNADRKKLLISSAIGILIRATSFTLAAYYGIHLFRSLYGI
jgi:membrane protein YqaA with SNARE-associated domain